MALTLAFLCVVFAIGLVIGSFLNVVILRRARGEGLGGRSRCDSCGALLRARELVPVISFCLQKARCRRCGAGLSWQYPAVEAATALIFVLIASYLLPYAASGVLSPLIFLSAFPAAAALIVLVVSDFKYQILPDGAVATLFVFGVAAGLARGALAVDLGTAAIYAAFFASLWFFSGGRWMGLGDAKLILATSLAVGFPASLVAFLFSFWLGGISGLVLLALGARDMQSRIPFGPFIIAGSAAAYFFSPQFLALTGLNMLW